LQQGDTLFLRQTGTAPKDLRPSCDNTIHCTRSTFRCAAKTR